MTTAEEAHNLVPMLFVTVKPVSYMVQANSHSMLL